MIPVSFSGERSNLACAKWPFDVTGICAILMAPICKIPGHQAASLLEQCSVMLQDKLGICETCAHNRMSSPDLERGIV